MPRFTANLSMLYPDSPFLDRFARARASGFRFCEYLFPYEYDPRVLANALDENGLSQVLFDLPPGNWAAGERGLASLPDRMDEFRASVSLAIQYARALDIKLLNCLAGNRDHTIPYQDQQRVVVENLRYAAACCAENEITLLVEPINPADAPGYWISSPRIAFELQDLVGAANLQVLFDIYHAQRTQGELSRTIQTYLSRIGHIQVADNPGRHQPGTGEINFRNLFAMLDRVGYRGWVGLEYLPEGSTEHSLTWMREYGYEL